jgi:hypothetical protein
MNELPVVVHGYIHDEPHTMLVWAPVRLNVTTLDKYFDASDRDAIVGYVISAMQEGEMQVAQGVIEFLAERARHRAN